MVDIVPPRSYYGDRCFSFGSLFVGATGGALLGHFTGAFSSSKPFDKLSLDVKSSSEKVRKIFKPLNRLYVGGNIYWRVAGQVLGPMIMYSYLECKFQQPWPRRHLSDCVFAGVITGGAFGLRGFPGGKAGVGRGAGGFALYAGLMYLIFRR